MKEMTVRDMMTTEVLTMGPDDELTALRDRMLGNRIRHIPIVDQRQRLVGLVTHRDLLRQTLMERPGLSNYVEDTLMSEVRAKEVMTTALELAEPEMDMRDAARVMLRNKIGCLPVVEGDDLVGIVTEADFLRVALYED